MLFSSLQYRYSYTRDDIYRLFKHSYSTQNAKPISDTIESFIEQLKAEYQPPAHYISTPMADPYTLDIPLISSRSPLIESPQAEATPSTFFHGYWSVDSPVPQGQSSDMFAGMTCSISVLSSLHLLDTQFNAPQPQEEEEDLLFFDATEDKKETSEENSPAVPPTSQTTPVSVPSPAPQPTPQPEKEDRPVAASSTNVQDLAPPKPQPTASVEQVEEPGIPSFHILYSPSACGSNSPCILPPVFSQPSRRTPSNNVLTAS